MNQTDEIITINAAQAAEYARLVALEAAFRNLAVLLDERGNEWFIASLDMTNLRIQANARGRAKVYRSAAVEILGLLGPQKGGAA